MPTGLGSAPSVQSLCTIDRGVGGCQRCQTPVLLTQAHTDKERFGFGVRQAAKIQMQRGELQGSGVGIQAHRLSSVAAFDMGAEDHSYREVWFAFSRLFWGTHVPPSPRSYLTQHKVLSLRCKRSFPSLLLPKLDRSLSNKEIRNTFLHSTVCCAWK